MQTKLPRAIPSQTDRTCAAGQQPDPKSQYRNPKQIRMRKTQNLRATDRPGSGKSGIRILNLFRASDFGIRAFALLTALPLSVTGLPAAVTVNNVDALKAAIEEANANPNADATILLEDGTYHLKWAHLWLARDGMTITGKSSNREAVILRGESGMRSGKTEFIFQVSADDVTISDLTLEDVGSHAVIIHGEAPFGADRTVLRNLVIRDTFQQMVKVTPANSDPQKFFSEGGVLEDCLLEYTAGIGPQIDIGGIDAHGAKDWILRQAIWVNNGTGPVLSNAITAPNSRWFGSVAPPALTRVSEVGNFLHTRDASITQVINKGTTNIANLPVPFTDFDGHRRPKGKGIDIGADQFRVQSPPQGLKLDCSHDYFT